ncbi:ribonuclease H-like domain-containing protein [Desarmillaria tabescens]|uniref:ribonuclease H n=1 Tax=Armillaria tabescens TaxID=1929756 RepID=A0AA39J8E8_ARMTA|nr:ribonuclease H-like domain-containing protein [Desarmillaria tabescens]KAK0437948.1 ribonuclease H-like domain-containing protein [Desarmillaria tabescens]
MNLEHSPGEEGVFARRFHLCERLARDFPLDELITQCACCDTYFVACCYHGTFKGDLSPCKNFRLIFVDGACSNNGQADATAGIGIVMGSSESNQWSIPIDDTLDPGAKRTSQRAELLAALEGLEMMRMRYFETDVEEYRNMKRHELRTFKTHNARDSSGLVTRPQWIIASDSENVVLGMTEWLPKWKRKGMRTSQGKRSANLDLYLKLDEAISFVERKGIDVGFWKIPRELNTNADEVAKMASRVAAMAS